MKMLVMASVMLAGVFVFTSCNKEGGTGGTTITEVNGLTWVCRAASFGLPTMWEPHLL
ncbi:MAG: hypothetical protein IJG41_03230 [Bacteroidales bacterium]|nr:hypothetical protein [Bacteroidales bacterium]